MSDTEIKQIDLWLPIAHQTQQKVLDCDARFIVLMCGRRWGKSVISQSLAIDNALNGKLVAYITPTYQLAKIFYEEIGSRLDAEYVTGNKSDLVFNFFSGGSIRFFTGERLDNLRGQKFHLAIIDEASYIPNLENGWLNAIRPTLTDFRGKAIFLSTPKGQNYFYSLYMKSGEYGWQSFKFTTYDNPHIAPEEIDDARSQLPIAVFEQEYMANPMENASNPFGSQFIKMCTKPQSLSEPLYFGIDVAKSVDWTVIIGLDQNGNVSYFKRFQKDWGSTKQEILNLPRKPIVIDSTGVGDPIYEDLLRQGIQIQGLKFTSQSKQQLMMGLQTAIQTGKIGFPQGVITEELEVFEYQYTPTGVKYSAPSGFHDDAVMALALAYHNMTMKAGSGRYNFL